MKPYIERILYALLDTVAVESGENPPPVYSEGDKQRCREMYSSARQIPEVTAQAVALTTMVKNSLHHRIECAELLANSIPIVDLHSKALSLVSDEYLAKGRCSEARNAAAKISLLDVHSEQMSEVAIAMSQVGRCRWN